MADTKKGKGLPQTLTLDHVSPATRLLEKRRQMFEVQEALNAQKEDFARRTCSFYRYIHINDPQKLRDELYKKTPHLNRRRAKST